MTWSRPCRRARRRRNKNLTQREIGRILAIPEPEVSRLVNGHSSRFTTDKMLDFRKRLGHALSIRISPHRGGELFQKVRFAPARRYGGKSIPAIAREAQKARPGMIAGKVHDPSPQA